MGDVICYKDLWTLLSCTNGRATSEVIDGEIKKSSRPLQTGICSFKRYSPDGKVTGEMAKMSGFFHSLGKGLNLDVQQSMGLACNYFLQVINSEDIIPQITKKNITLASVFPELEKFYFQERLFLLKCTNLIFSHCKNEGHPYQEIFMEYVKSISTVETFDLFLQQFDISTSQRPDDLDLTEKKLDKLNIDMREQVEILHNFILFEEIWNDYDPRQFFRLLTTFKSDGFGTKNSVWRRNYHFNQDCMTVIGYLQIILILKSFDFDWITTNILRDEIKLYISIDSEIRNLGSDEHHGPVLLIWVIFKLLGKYDHTRRHIHEQQLELAKKLMPFIFLDKILKHRIFKDHTTLREVTYLAVRDFLFVVCTNFDKSFLRSIRGGLELIAVVLQSTTVAYEFWHSSRNVGFYPIIHMATEWFPGQLFPYLLYFDALTESSSPGIIRKIHNDFQQIGTFGEALEVFDMRELTKLDGTRFLAACHRNPLPYANYEIPPGTFGSIEDARGLLMKWNCKLNFYTVVCNQQKRVIAEVIDNPNINENVTFTATSCEYCMKIVRNILLGAVDIPPEVDEAINNVFLLLTRYKMLKMLSSSLFARCIDIVRALLLRDEHIVLVKLKRTQFMPIVSTTTDPQSGDFIVSRTFLPRCMSEILFNGERIRRSYPALIAYLEFVYALLKLTIKDSRLNRSMGPVNVVQDFILPGVVFVLNEVFPGHRSWNYDDPCDQTSITVLSILILHEMLIFDRYSTVNQDLHDKLKPIQEIVLQHVQCYSPGTVLLEIVSIGESALHKKISTEYHWDIRSSRSCSIVLQLALSILRIVLVNTSEMNKECRLMKVIYQARGSRDLEPGVIPKISSYLMHSFNRQIRTLAVRILERFAYDYPYSLITSMNKEGSEIRKIFVDILESRSESQAIKSAILHLAIACIDNQAGMNSALYNIHLTTKDTKDTPSEEVDDGGILNYVCDILGIIEKDPSQLVSETYIASVKLIYHLWLSPMVVVNFLRKRKNFWKHLCLPLFLSSRPPSETCTYLLEVLAYEIYFYGQDVDKELISQVNTFLDENSSYLSGWCQYIASLCDDKDDLDMQDIPGDVNILDKQHLWNILDDVPLDPSWDINSDETRSRHNKIFKKFGLTKDQIKLGTILAWEHFLLSLKETSVEISVPQKKIIINHIFDVLVMEVTKEHLKPVLILAEICLVLAERWQCPDLFIQESTAKGLVKILHCLSEHYLVLADSLRRTMLSLALKIISVLNVEALIKDEISADILLHSLMNISLNEIRMIDEPTPVSVSVFLPTTMKSVLPLASKNLSKEEMEEAKLWPTCYYSLCVVQKYLYILSKSQQWEIYLIPESVVETYLRTLRSILTRIVDAGKFTDHFEIAVQLIQILLILARSGYHAKLVSLNISYYLWLQLTPPTFLIKKEVLIPFSALPALKKLTCFFPMSELCDFAHRGRIWVEQPWSKLYEPGIDLVTTLLELNGAMFIKSTLDFLGIHQEYLACLIATHMVDVKLVNLKQAIKALTLLRRVVDFSSSFDVREELSVTTLLLATMGCLNASAAYLINPSVLQRNIREEGDVTINSLTVTSIKNCLLDIAHMCLTIFNPLCPPIENLLQPSYVNDWDPIVWLDYSTPSISQYKHMNKLSMGLLITLINIASQTLAKNIRVTPSPGGILPKNIVDGSTFLGFGLSSQWVSTLNMERAHSVLELTLDLLIKHVVIYIRKEGLGSKQTIILKSNLSTEMKSFLQYAEGLPDCLPADFIEKIRQVFEYLGLSLPVEKPPVKPTPSAPPHPSDQQFCFFPSPGSSIGILTEPSDTTLTLSSDPSYDPREVRMRSLSEIFRCESATSLPSQLAEDLGIGVVSRASSDTVLLDRLSQKSPVSSSNSTVQLPSVEKENQLIKYYSYLLIELIR